MEYNTFWTKLFIMHIKHGLKMRLQMYNKKGIENTTYTPPASQIFKWTSIYLQFLEIS